LIENRDKLSINCLKLSGECVAPLVAITKDSAAEALVDDPLQTKISIVVRDVGWNVNGSMGTELIN
jgi:hypothetical protein